MGALGALPVGLTDANTYRIRRLPDPALMIQYRRDALQAAAAMSVPPGGVAGPVAPVVQLPAQVVAQPAGPEDAWVRIETAGDKLRGEIVTMDGSEYIQGDLAVKTIDGQAVALRRMRTSEIEDFKGKEAAADARLLGVSFQGLSRAERQWRDVSKEIHEEKFEDWEVPGPRTSEWCDSSTERTGGPWTIIDGGFNHTASKLTVGELQSMTT